MATIVGNYVLGERIGVGGAGDVFAAHHRFLGDPVVVKLLQPSGGSPDLPLDELVAEATALRAIVHDNVVRVIDCGVDQDAGRCYLVMERLEGVNLSSRIRAGGPLPESDLRPLGAAIADGVAAAHELGVVHRDLKPSNIMLCDGTPKIIDFGISSQLGDQSVARTRRLRGTIAFMAPELLTGGLVSPSVDVWAFGALMFAAASGSLPFSGYDDGRCPQLFESARRLGDLAPVSPAFDALVARCLLRDPGRRPASMAEIAEELGGADGERYTADLGSTRQTAVASPPRARRWRGPKLATAAAVAAIAIAAAALWIGRDEVSLALLAPAVPAPNEIEVNDEEPPPAEVVVNSTPEGAHVLLDGALIGITPARFRSLELPASLTLHKNGYVTREVVIREPSPPRFRLERESRRTRRGQDRRTRSIRETLD